MYLDSLTNDLPGEPRFRPMLIRDTNSVAATEKMRVIQQPNEAMRELHLRLVVELRALKVRLAHATAALPGSSPRVNVLPHRGNRYFYLLDLKDAYGAASVVRLAGVLGKIDSRLEGLERETGDFLSRYCFVEGRGLATGGPASPDLFNVYAGILLDDPIGELALANGWVYTRYLDDLTLSAPEPLSEQDRRNVRTVVSRAGFRVSHRKARVIDLAKGPVIITGIGVELGGRLFLPRHYLRKLQGAIHLAQRGKLAPERLAGMMGTFWAVTERSRLTAGERKVALSYQAYRDSLRSRRRASVRF